MEPARAESVVRAVEGWRAAVRRGASAWDALSRALAALEEGQQEQAADGGGGDNQEHEARMRVYEELIQEAPSAALSAFFERARSQGSSSRARRRKQNEEAAASSTAVVSAPLCAFAAANDSRSAAEALQSALTLLRESLEDAENASAVLSADAEALESEAAEGAAAARLESALLVATAASWLRRELGWMRRAVAGAGPETPLASAEAAADMWRLQPFTDDEAMEALLGGAERMAGVGAASDGGGGGG